MRIPFKQNSSQEIKQTTTTTATTKIKNRLTSFLHYYTLVNLVLIYMKDFYLFTQKPYHLYKHSKINEYKVHEL